MQGVNRALRISGVIVAAQVTCQGVSQEDNRVDFLLSGEERRSYEAYIRDENQADFSLSVRMGADKEPLAATAHLRGHSSFSCERRSFTLNFYGNRPRNALTDSATDEFYLMSLCKDDRYVHQYTVLQLWKRLGLFPFDFRLVELRIDGQSQGVYLLVEKLDRLRITSDRLTAVLRRMGQYGKTEIDVKFSRSPAQTELDDYYAFLQSLEELSGAELMAAFLDRMDLDQYLRWLATNTILRNGDSIDELWLLATDQVDSTGAHRSYYRFAGWDPEDIYQPCHLGGGSSAFVDRYELVYCAEAEWDHHLLSDPVGYDHYVDILKETTQTHLTDEVFQEARERTERELSALLSRPGVAASMVELLAVNPDAADPAVAKDEIRRALEKVALRFSKERATLLEGIAAYHNDRAL